MVDLREKAGYGLPCRRCGTCCAAEVCPIGKIADPAGQAPCNALVRDGEGVFACALVLLEIEAGYAPLVQKVLGIGCGCSCPDEGTTEEEMLEFEAKCAAAVSAGGADGSSEVLRIKKSRPEVASTRIGMNTLIEVKSERAPEQRSVPENCLDCRHHEMIRDPDPEDWFCDDDKAVVCTITQNPSQDIGSKYLSNRHPNRAVTVSTRPYAVRAESERPAWCPLAQQQGAQCCG